MVSVYWVFCADCKVIKSFLIFQYRFVPTSRVKMLSCPYNKTGGQSDVRVLSGSWLSNRHATHTDWLVGLTDALRFLAQCLGHDSKWSLDDLYKFPPEPPLGHPSWVTVWTKSESQGSPLSWDRHQQGQNVGVLSQPSKSMSWYRRASLWVLRAHAFGFGFETSSADPSGPFAQ